MKSFWEIAARDFFIKKDDELEQLIKSEKKEHILGVNEDDYIEYLVDKFRLEPLSVFFEEEIIEEPKKETKYERTELRNNREYEQYKFTVKYPYEGSKEIFSINPSKHSFVHTEIFVKDQYVGFSFNLRRLDEEQFSKLKEQYKRHAFSNLQFANEDIDKYNNELEGKARTHYFNRKRHFEREGDFYKAINVQVNPKTKSLFTPPTIKKKVIPKPKVEATDTFESQPTMANEMYNDILKIIYNVGMSIERKPTLYRDKGEEEIRDQFLLFLETRYEGITATGETFNKNGKTDILLKNAEDGSNLFVAECKIWRGKVEYQKAISQLFDRYLTWRDSKTALLVFVKNKDMTKVMSEIEVNTKTHSYYSSFIRRKHETSFSYKFHLPGDKFKEVYLEVMVFDFYEYERD